MSQSEHVRVGHTTAAEIGRNFGYWQDQAIFGPVTVTSHGRPRVVMLSVPEYERLTLQEGEPVGAAQQDERGNALAGLIDHMNEGFVALDADMRITAANTTVGDFLGRSVEQLIGRDIQSLEGPGAGVLADRYRWVMRSGEKMTFEASAYLRPDRHLSATAFPWRGGVGIVFANRTELNRLRAEREAWQALQAALNACGGVLTAELTPLGFFTTANAALADFLGFRAEQLTRTRLTELVATADRSGVAQALNALVAQQSKAETLEVTFLTREQGRRTVRFGLAPILRDTVCAGLVLTGLAGAPGAL